MTTNNGNGFPPSIRVARLFRKTSKTGATYFSGRWGGAKIALVKSKETSDSGEEIWSLLFSEAPQNSQAKPEESSRAAYAAPATYSAPAEPYVERRLLDDEIPF
jgi:hypothetical protein